ncbi:hypothetical protein [Mycolicibacterium chitae]|uniref:Secreted protein n=1 Tax=Mycolicibacterium chitae TaxID=1792 RepID=A0A3S4VGL0_MYCCI|nr:hypothetical protein [Mycolicibacterium chitae]MCV7108756.1 hypothetical protein [Mycolicibacterium chitae]VEG47079.1 Uncharacterised protein [Mycolicibacterium chitae]
MKSIRAALSAVASVVLVAAAISVAPTANAMYFGNYNLHIPDRRDFHTWIFSTLTPCKGVPAEGATCMRILTIPQPVAKAVYTHADAVLGDDGFYTMVIDDPFGLRCGDIYYGPTIPTHDVYRWHMDTLAGEMVSHFAAGCDGAPGGSFTYPISLTRM